MSGVGEGSDRAGGGRGVRWVYLLSCGARGLPVRLLCCPCVFNAFYCVRSSRLLSMQVPCRLRTYVKERKCPFSYIYGNGTGGFHELLQRCTCMRRRFFRRSLKKKSISCLANRKHVYYCTPSSLFRDTSGGLSCRLDSLR